jgi:magnesium chelatase family protein
MIATIYSSAVYGLDAYKITVEVSVSKGLGYQITGLPDDAIKESLTRMAIVIGELGYYMPRTKLVINLAPADMRKCGTALDLAAMIGILLASEQLSGPGKLRDYCIVGEIGLDGKIYKVHGALCMAEQAKRDGFKGIIVPFINAQEASMVKGIDVYAVKHVKDLIGFILSDCVMEPYRPCNNHPLRQSYEPALDFKEVKGQQHVIRAMEIAAAGGHNSLMVGGPGVGKTTIAKRLPSILPPMTDAESLETTKIYSLLRSGETINGLITTRPFRNPHHTASDVALAGGGSYPLPGEISLSHNGVLFLDELPEFKRSAIEVLRQPLEERKVIISRAKMSVQYPASFMLLAAMNPCLCGYYGHPVRKCICSKRAMWWYRRRISGPLLERIDLHIDVESVPLSEMMAMENAGECSAFIRKRVVAARNIQTARFKNLEGVFCNAQMPHVLIDEYCCVEESIRKFLIKTIDHQQLSPRSYHRVLKVARTIADLKASKMIELPHIAEALHFRGLDKPITKKN